MYPRMHECARSNLGARAAPDDRLWPIDSGRAVLTPRHCRSALAAECAGDDDPYKSSSQNPNCNPSSAHVHSPAMILRSRQCARDATDVSIRQCRTTRFSLAANRHGHVLTPYSCAVPDDPASYRPSARCMPLWPRFQRFLLSADNSSLARPASIRLTHEALLKKSFSPMS